MPALTPVIVPVVTVASAVSTPPAAMTDSPPDQLQRRRSRVGSAFASVTPGALAKPKSRSHSSVADDPLSAAHSRVAAAVAAAGDVTDGTESELGMQY